VFRGLPQCRILITGGAQDFTDACVRELIRRYECEDSVATEVDRVPGQGKSIRRGVVLKEVESSRRLDAALLQSIIQVSQRLHGQGTFFPQVLEVLARHLSSQPIRHSVETGAGASTLIFSHVSSDHTVFALDLDGSVTNTRASELFHPVATVFVEGPTQKTLPTYVFRNKLQAALLDGPHAFPFPHLEYYYIYPHLEEGALLIIDDIQIRTVHDFFKFLKADKMFRLLEVAGTTAFFRRTSAPTFNPYGHEWWLQKYNERRVPHVVWKDRLNRPLPVMFESLLRYAKRSLGRLP
jgi:hypothetical protein